MEGAPDDDRARLAFFASLAESELVVLLTREADGEAIEPSIFETADGAFVLVFDTEDRLTAFTGAPAPFAALSGRSIAEHLAGQNVGLGVNLGVAPSSILLPPDAIGWLASLLARRPDQINAIPREVAPPAGLPEILLSSLDARLARAAGLAASAYLTAVTYDDARRGHMLALIDALPDAQPSLARLIGEALIFSGIDAGELDIVFLRASDPLAARLAKVGLRFDLPDAPKAEAPAAPGLNPDKPPRLR
jgi:hypothetical protein